MSTSDVAKSFWRKLLTLLFQLCYERVKTESFPSSKFQSGSQLDTYSLPWVVKCYSEQTYAAVKHTCRWQGVYFLTRRCQTLLEMSKIIYAVQTRLLSFQHLLKTISITRRNKTDSLGNCFPFLVHNFSQIIWKYFGLK